MLRYIMEGLVEAKDLTETIGTGKKRYGEVREGDVSLLLTMATGNSFLASVESMCKTFIVEFNEHTKRGEEPSRFVGEMEKRMQEVLVGISGKVEMNFKYHGEEYYRGKE